MLGNILASVGLPVLIRTVAEALGGLNNPVAKTASEALKQVDRAVTGGAISLDEIKEGNRHLEKIAETDSTEFKTLIEQINTSLRAEIASQDIYVRRMRPTFGYIMAVTWAAQMLAIAVVIVDQPKEAGTVINAMSSLSGIWTIGLSVLGIYVYKRSQEKIGNKN